jgi:hypothetical protein
MGKPWSEKRHLAVALKRMKDIKSGKATTRFWMGRVAEFKNKGIIYQLAIYNDSIQLSADKGKKRTIQKENKG